MRSSALLSVVLAACLVCALPAQRPSSWVAAPAGAVGASAVSHLGKLLWFVDHGTLHVFSAATRTWASRPVSANAAIRNTNDFLLLVDGGAITALSSVRCRFETVPASPQATVLNPSSGRNDGILLVLDGSTLWSFTGFSGRWTSRAVSASALIAVQRNVAIVADGSNLWGMSSMFATWVPWTMSGTVQSVGSGDTLGWASDGVGAHGFSAIRNSWTSTTLPQGAQPVPATDRDAAVWTGPFEVLGYSGVRGAFALAATGQPTNVDVSDHLAHAYSIDNRQHWMFSVPEATWTHLATAQPASTLLSAATALLLEPTQVHAYSALTAAFAPPLASTTTAVNATVAAALESGSGSLRLFSALTGAWHAAPATAVAALPQLARNGALLHDGSATAWAFSARSGRFLPRALGAHPQLHVDSGSGILAIEDDGALAAFDARREAWVATPIVPTDRPLDLRIWRTTLVAITPTEAIGFSSMHGAIERAPLPGTLIEPRASSEVGAAITNGGVVAYSAVSDLRTEAQFPEFRRMFGRGSRVDLHLTGIPGALGGAVAGLAGAVATPLPGVGELLLDPALLLPIAIGALSAEGVATVLFPIPDSPSLAGLELGFQGVVAPPAGAPYLTRLTTFRVH